MVFDHVSYFDVLEFTGYPSNSKIALAYIVKVFLNSIHESAPLVFSQCERHELQGNEDKQINGFHARPVSMSCYDFHL